MILDILNNSQNFKEMSIDQILQKAQEEDIDKYELYKRLKNLQDNKSEKSSSKKRLRINIIETTKSKKSNNNKIDGTKNSINMNYTSPKKSHFADDDNSKNVVSGKDNLSIH